MLEGLVSAPATAAPRRDAQVVAPAVQVTAPPAYPSTDGLLRLVAPRADEPRADPLPQVRAVDAASRLPRRVGHGAFPLCLAGALGPVSSRCFFQSDSLARSHFFRFRTE